MASSSKGKKAMPRRMTAEKVRQLFACMNDDDDDSDSASLDGSDYNFSDVDSDTSSTSESRNSRDSPDEVEGALPQPGPSGERPAKRPRPTRPTRTTDDGVVWREVQVMPNHEMETGNNFRFLPKDNREPGLNADLNGDSSPLTCLTTLLTDEMRDSIIDSINSYARQKVDLNSPALRRSRYANWKPVDRYEFTKFLAVVINMGIDKRGCIRDYWSNKPSLYTPWYHQMFARERFETMYHTMLHVGELDAAGKHKIEPFVEALCQQFSQAFTPFQEVSIDEMIIGWKGRWKYKQFNASKPKKYHIKSFGLVDSTTGYVLNLLTYYGKETSYNPLLDVDTYGSNSVKIFDTLLQQIGTGYHIYADRWYTTMNLMEYLQNARQYYTGTVQTNRVGFPQEVRGKGLKLKHTEAKFWMEGDNRFLCCAWQDKKAKKPVIITSSKARVALIQGDEKKKPEVIEQYNFSMNGCDRADQMVGYYGLHARRTKKWWKKIFYWVLEITSVNAFILHRLAQDPAKNLSSTERALKVFKLRLIDEMCEVAATMTPNPTTQVHTKPGRPRTSNPLQRLEGCKHLIRHVPQDRRCQVCSKPNAVKRTNFICVGCENHPHLHPKGCFEIWHTQTSW